MPNAKAMGTPMATATPTMPTKNRIRLPRPSAMSAGCAAHSAAAIAPTVRIASSTARARRVWSSRSKASTAASEEPTRTAETRHASEKGRVVSSVKTCCSTYCLAGSRISSTNTITTSALTAPNHSATAGGTHPIRVVNRMCPSRRSATTMPSIDSHRKRNVASSSDQISGASKT